MFWSAEMLLSTMNRHVSFQLKSTDAFVGDEVRFEVQVKGARLHLQITREGGDLIFNSLA